MIESDQSTATVLKGRGGPGRGGAAGWSAEERAANLRKAKEARGLPVWEWWREMPRLRANVRKAVEAEVVAMRAAQ